MNTEQARTHVIAVLRRIAPEADLDEVPPDVDLRDELDLDSMDFLSVLTTIEEQTGVTVPELDYPQIMTIDQFADYLAARLQTA